MGYHILFVFVVSLLFTMSICSLVSNPRGWSLGKLNNVREVFGSSVFLWLLPVSTSLGDGLRFSCQVQEDGSNYQSIGTAACHRPLSTPAESPRFSRTLVNPVLGSAGKVATVFSISEE